MRGGARGRTGGGPAGRRTARIISAVAVLGGLVSSADSARAETPAPEPGRIEQAAQPVAGEYVVTLDRAEVSASEAGPEARALAERHDGTVLYVYEQALRGFAVRMSEDEARALSTEPGVLAVTENGLVRATTTQADPPSWGLDRIDQEDRPLDAAYTYGATGAGVRAYIIDTGIRASHTDLGGRVAVGYDAIGDGQNTNDCNGHGTHVAGTVGGSSYGVAKGVSLVAVRVLNCSGTGSYAQIIAGVDWVTTNRVLPAVANMSLGGSAYAPLNTAVANSIAAGVTYAVAAGNETTDACTRSPASTPSALTVGATDSSDVIADFSNVGTCLDLFAPGVGITSAWSSSDTATNTISGTSMAAPHVAGVVARYLQANPSDPPAEVAAAITGNAVQNRVPCAGTSPNRLLYSRFLDGTAPGSPPPPPGAPANDAFAAAQELTGAAGGSVTGTNTCATSEAGEPNHAGVSGGHSVWFRWTAGGSSPATFDTVGSSYDTTLAVYRGTSVGALTAVGSNDDLGGGSLQSRVQFTPTPGTTYQVAVDGYSTRTGDVTLNWTGTGQSVDGTDPTVDLRTPPEGAVYGRGEVVAADFSCGDESGGSGLASCVGTVADGAGVPTSVLGGRSFVVTATDNAGNSTSVTHHYSVVDGTDPTVTITTPPAGAVYARHEAVIADFSCADDAGGSGIDTCVGTVPDGQHLDTSALGPHELTVTATDRDGNTTTATHTYTVAYPPHGYPDVPDGSLADDALDWAKAEGVVVADFPDGGFHPAASVNRGQIANILWTFVDQPAGSPPHGFADVPAGAWYGDGLDWARAEGLVSGYRRAVDCRPRATPCYRPRDPVLRGQLVNMLWHLVGEPTGFPPFAYTDIPPAAPYRDAMAWADAHDLINTDGTSAQPRRAATRAETVYILHRLASTAAAWSAYGSDPPSAVVF